MAVFFYLNNYLGFLDYSLKQQKAQNEISQHAGGKIITDNAGSTPEGLKEINRKGFENIKKTKNYKTHQNGGKAGIPDQKERHPHSGSFIDDNLLRIFAALNLFYFFGNPYGYEAKQ